MEKKNVKGYIGLFLGLASIILILVGVFVPMTKLTGFGLGGKLSLHGTPNIAMIWIAVVCAIAAIVFGAMSKKDADKKGPRKPGVIIGILCVIFGLISALTVGLLSSMTEFINSEGKNGMVAEMVKDNDDLKKTMDELIRGLQKGAEVKETGLPGYVAKNEASKTAADKKS